MKIIGDSKLSKVLVFYFFICGLWSKFPPNTIAATLYTIVSYTMHFTLSFCYTGFMVVGLLFISDVDQITLSICVTFTCVAYVAKIFNFYWHNVGMKNCFKSVNDFVLENEFESEFLRTRMEPLRKIALLYYIIPNVCGVTAYLKPLFAAKTELPFLGWYPLDWTNNSLHYWIAYVYQIIGILIEINLNVTMELFPSYLMHMLSIQMEILGFRLQRISSSICDSDVLIQDIAISRSEQQLVVQEMVELLKLHQHMDKLAESIEQNFTMAFFAQICLSGTVMCCIAYQLTYTSPIENIIQYCFFVSFLMGVVIQIFLPCYFGNEIMLTSAALSNHVYSSSWHSFSLKYRKLVITFMERLKRTRTLLVGKLFPLSLDTFTSIVYFAYRLYAVIGTT
ncbi:putative odorant receptor 71a [Pseudolycoriella hygida]|uniref:Odorant receptor n=1 Tax=Pseudolycoriella hygida TaxID=35572 RepID=A0A9Q0MR19_9DIPT|nr:putative odorant receptor 71a [Pseudolycoriella hygida]